MRMTRPLRSPARCSWLSEPFLQGNVDANVARQSELLVLINKHTASYRQAFGFREWRQACEVGCTLPLWQKSGQVQNLWD